MKKAIYVYFYGYHPGNLKKLKENFGSIWWFFYAVFILPSINSSETIYASAQNAFLYFSLAIAGIFPWISNTLVPLTLQKQMYLCPMKQGEREKYIVDLLGIKLAVPGVLLGSMMVVYAYCFQLNVFILCGIFLTVMSLIVASALRSTSAWCVGYELFCVIFWYFLMIAMLDKETLSWGIQCFWGIILILQLIADIAIIIYKLPVAIKNATDYESSMQMQKKAEGMHKR